MIRINHLTKRFGSIIAVDDVSFDVQRGEVLGFLGPNGAGKSTTMKMVTGFLTPTSGTAVVAGHDVLQEPQAVKRALGYLPEGAPGYPEMTPRAFLGFIAEIRGLTGAEKRRRIDEVVERVHLESVVNQTFETLSKGYKRRVGLAQAILHDPEVLIMDEPTDGLDPNQKHEVRTLIREMAPEKAIVLSTHILEEVEAVCTRALIISQGRLVMDGTPDELCRRSRRHNAVSITVEGGSPESLRAELEALEHVAGLEQLASDNGRVTFLLYAADGRPITSEVGRLAHDRKWIVSELHSERGRMDEVFRDITTGDLEAPVS